MMKKCQSQKSNIVEDIKSLLLITLELKEEDILSINIIVIGCQECKRWNKKNSKEKEKEGIEDDNEKMIKKM